MSSLTSFVCLLSKWSSSWLYPLFCTHFVHRCADLVAGRRGRFYYDHLRWHVYRKWNQRQQGSVRFLFQWGNSGISTIGSIGYDTESIIHSCSSVASVSLCCSGTRPRPNQCIQNRLQSARTLNIHQSTVVGWWRTLLFINEPSRQPYLCSELQWWHRGCSSNQYQRWESQGAHWLRSTHRLVRQSRPSTRALCSLYSSWSYRAECLECRSRCRSNLHLSVSSWKWYTAASIGDPSGETRRRSETSGVQCQR